LLDRDRQSHEVRRQSSRIAAVLRHSTLRALALDRVLHHYGPKYQTPRYKVSNTREAIRLRRRASSERKTA